MMAENNDFSDNDINNYENSCSCEVDGPFQQFDDQGNPLPMDYSNIIAAKTQE